MSKDDVYISMIDSAKKYLDYNRESGVFTWKNTEKQYGKTRDGFEAGFVAKNGFHKIKLLSKSLCSHKIAFALCFGFLPKNGLYHVDRNRLNNSINNIKPVPDGYSYSAWMKHLDSIDEIKENGLYEKLITRNEAISAGLSTYFTGLKCKNGHIAERSVAGRCCVKCNSEFSSREDQKKKRAVNEKARVSRLSESDKLERLAKMNNWYHSNKDKVLAMRDNNKDRYNEWAREYRKRKIKEDPIFAIKSWLRITTNKLLKRTGNGRIDSSFNVVGYTGFELRKNIESKFKEGMSWDNRSSWHIDHVVPIKVLLDNGVTNPAIINHLDNLSPEWAEYNLSKGAKCLDVELMNKLIAMNEAE